MENATYTDLKTIVKLVKNKELLLPDFQRGFVWNVEKQQKLVASILAKVPVGSLLVLEANRDDYGCRILGRRDEPIFDGTEGQAYVLLDGQQRMTVLANVFSNLLYYDYEKTGKLITDYKTLISRDLQMRFFLQIQAVGQLDETNDFFNLRGLNFPIENPDSDECKPTFLTSEIRDYICYVPFDENTVGEYTPHADKPQNINHYCISSAGYKIPLFLLINEIGNNSNEIRLKNVLKDIVTEVVRYRIENEYDVLDKELEEEKIAFVKKNIKEDYWDTVIVNGRVNRTMLEEKWISSGEVSWADNMRRYLTSCITHMELHQIVVTKSERNRAIDIYENLNIGGVTLSTFELILAKAAKKTLPNNKNLFEQIVTYIQTEHVYAKEVIPERMEKYCKTDPYSASEMLSCYDEKKNQLNTKYSDAFLNVLSLVCNNANYATGKMELAQIKREKIMDLKAYEITDNYEKVCKGIDRACHFLQVRCGIRKIQEVNYNLMLVLLGYIYSNDVFYQDKNIAKMLEAWYWASIFSGRYDKDQTAHIIEDIKNILNAIRTDDTNWLEEMKKRVFDMQGFSDEKTLLLQTSVTPKNVIRKSICQFYLSQTYRDLRTPEIIHVFSENADTLEEHHIVPIGTLQDTYRNMEKTNRKNKGSLFNSPVNFALITKKSNLDISNNPVDYYIRHCNKDAVLELNLDDITMNVVDEKLLEKALHKRLEKIESLVHKRIADYL